MQAVVDQQRAFVKKYSVLMPCCQQVLLVDREFEKSLALLKMDPQKGRDIDNIGEDMF